MRCCFEVDALDVVRFEVFRFEISGSRLQQASALRCAAALQNVRYRVPRATYDYDEERRARNAPPKAGPQHARLVTINPMDRRLNAKTVSKTASSACSASPMKAAREH
jgi:hypothetical protein